MSHTNFCPKDVLHLIKCIFILVDYNLVFQQPSLHLSLFVPTNLVISRNKTMQLRPVVAPCLGYLTFNKDLPV